MFFFFRLVVLNPLVPPQEIFPLISAQLQQSICLHSLFLTCGSIKVRVFFPLKPSPPPLGVCLHGEVSLTTSIQDTGRQLSNEIRSETQAELQENRHPKNRHILQKCVFHHCLTNTYNTRLWCLQILPLSFHCFLSVTLLYITLSLSGCGINMDYTLSLSPLDWITDYTTSDDT